MHWWSHIIFVQNLNTGHPRFQRFRTLCSLKYFLEHSLDDHQISSWSHWQTENLQGTPDMGLKIHSFNQCCSIQSRPQSVLGVHSFCVKHNRHNQISFVCILLALLSELNFNDVERLLAYCTTAAKFVDQLILKQEIASLALQLNQLFWCGSFSSPFNSCSALNKNNHTWTSLLHSLVTRSNVLDHIIFKQSPFKTSCFAVELGRKQEVRVSADFQGA